MRMRASFADPPASCLDDEIRLARSLTNSRRAAGSPAAVERRLASVIARVARRLTGPCRLQRLGDDLSALFRISSSQSASFSFVARSTNERMATLRA